MKKKNTLQDERKLEKIREYFIKNNIIDENSRINVDFLGETPTEFAIEKVPSEPILERYIDGSSYRQFQFQLLSCNNYGSDVMQNIANSTYYEQLYELIEKNSKKKNLPEIEGIDAIECLNDGGIVDAGTNTARYSIQMRITYYKK